ncbi:hypothetical protein ACN4EG_23490 [Alkalinema pantanalense CENA528]|uniref:hypothetical protein n=1 Tax=Alkalinema pantanalense TaxID=1620705 RepID=UPI003D6F152C
MTDTLQLLKQITTGYSVFEPDQVLTEQQLNSISDYFDDQTRLTRLFGLGVGIAAGLRVSVQENQVVVTKGVGLTTDGDLLYLAQDTVFDRIQPYDASKPKYAPFYIDNTMITVYELLLNGSDTPEGTPLKDFSFPQGTSLNTLVALLLMESYDKDDDLCSGTDCDNLGKDRLNTPRLILVDQSALKTLQPDIPTPHQAFAKLDEITVDRVTIPTNLNAFSDLAQRYRTTCNTIHDRVVAELTKLYPACSAFLGDVFSTDPTPAWITKLNTLRNRTFGGNNSFGIQYYYDFLKDVAETYNQFRDLLWEDQTWCCPSPDSFPKHLLLGNVIPGEDPEANRFGFYPSPITSSTIDCLNQAKFLAQTLNALIENFQVPAAGTPIRITPSLFEDQPLAERAIPYYYATNGRFPIHRAWNYHLHQRRRDEYNYSYNASSYGAKGGAASPLTTQLGRFSFFRIEGHLGQPVTAAVAAIEREISARNLPFTVRSVLLGNERSQVVKKPGIRYTDLHRFHYVLRRDAFHQLDEVGKFSDRLKKMVDANVGQESNATTLRQAAEQSNNTIAGKVTASRTKLNRSYSSYVADASWKADLSDTLRTAGEYKFNLSDVVKTEFTTPFDSILSQTHLQWLDWLDDLIKRKDEKADDKLLFKNFIADHTEIEHFGGVVRGGTFILIHDSNQTVVADFMLPYYWEDVVEEEAEDLTWTKPTIRPDWVIENGVKVIPSLSTVFTDKITGFKREFEPIWEEKLNLQKNYFDVFKQSVTLMSDVVQKDYLKIFQDSVTLTSNVITKRTTDKVGVNFADPLLGIKVNETELNRQKVDILRQKAQQPDLPADQRKLFEQQAKDAEVLLARSIQDTTTYISTTGVDVSGNSEGLQAMLTVSDSMKSITQAETLKGVQDNLVGLQKQTKNTGLKITLGNLLR